MVEYDRRKGGDDKRHESENVRQSERDPRLSVDHQSAAFAYSLGISSTDRCLIDRGRYLELDDIGIFCQKAWGFVRCTNVPVAASLLFLQRNRLFLLLGAVCVSTDPRPTQTGGPRALEI